MIKEERLIMTMTFITTSINTMNTELQNGFRNNVQRSPKKFINKGKLKVNRCCIQGSAQKIRDMRQNLKP